MASDSARIKALADRLTQGIMSQLDEVYLNGDALNRYPGCVNLSFAYVEGESLLMALKRIALSSGSACTSASLEPSYVLRALGASDDLAHSSIRFGIGRFTTEEEVDITIDEVSGALFERPSQAQLSDSHTPPPPSRSLSRSTGYAT